MTHSYAVTGFTNDDDLVAFGKQNRSFVDLARAAAWTQKRLDGESCSADGPPPLLLCTDRFHFAAAMLGCWLGGRPVLLPPARGKQALAELGELSGCVLVDQPDARGVDVSAWEDASCDSGAHTSDSPLAALAGLALPADRHLVTVFSSGTTGQPTPARKTARQLLGEARTLRGHFNIQPGDRVLCTVAPQHIYGLLFGVLVPLTAGASFARGTPSSAASILSSARDAQTTVLVSVPPQWEAMASRGAVPLEATRLGLSSGAPLARRVGQQVLERLGVCVVEVLGSTETGGIATRDAATDDAFRALPGVEIRAGNDGQLLLRSPFLENADTELETADRIEWLGAGAFRHLGRADGVVKIGAKRVSLQELERCAGELLGVDEAAAVRIDAPGLRGSEIWLAVAARTLDAHQIRSALAARLDAVFVPRRIRVVERLPRDATGKLARARLLSLFDEPPR